MARSKDVYTVLGLMCVDSEFREAVFAQPNYATALVGSLSPDEEEQINGLAGLPSASDTQREAFITNLRQQLEGVRMALGCPNFPCPDRDPFTAEEIEEREEAEEDPLET